MTARSQGAPTLGTQILEWIEDDAELVHGAGTVQGTRVLWLPDPARGIVGDPERCGIVQRAYELYPSPQCPHCLEWNDVEAWDHHRRRKGKSVGWTCPAPKCGEPLPPVRGWPHYKISRPKGWSKSGFASKIVIVEAVGPSQFGGWDAAGEPVGIPHESPVIRCFATEEGQADHTYKPVAYMAGHLGESDWARRNDVKIDTGLSGGERSTKTIIRTTYGTSGLIEPQTSGAASKAGAQTTFAVADETWKWFARMIPVWNDEVLNVGKGSTPGWLLETTTYPEPGKGSVAELTMDAGTGEPPFALHVDHRGFRDMKWLVDAETLEIDREKFAAECRHAYGSATWAYNLPSRLAYFQRPDLDLASTIRQYGNAAADVSDRFIGKSAWEACRDVDVEPSWQPDDGEWITVGFDGSLTDDHTGLIGFHVPTSRLFVIGHWNPADTPTDRHPDGQVDQPAVDRNVRSAFDTWHLPRGYFDPPHWRSWLASWQRKHDGAKDFETAQDRRMTAALRAFKEAVQQQQVRHTGHPALTQHVLNAVLVTDASSVRDKEAFPDGRKWRLSKPTRTKHDPTNKIDLAVCAVLAFVAGLDSRAGDEKPAKKKSKAWSY